MIENLATWLLAAAMPSAPAVWDVGRWWSYEELDTRMREVAAYLGDRNARGTIVPLYGEASFGLIAAYLGTLYAGAIPAPLSPQSDAVIGEVLRETGASIALCDAASAARFRGAGVEVLELDAPLGDRAAAPAAVDPRALALLLYTSGSTSNPRGVMLSSENLRFSANAIHAFAPLAATDRALVTLPFYYCYGLSVLHTHLRAGAAVVLATSSIPEALLDLAEATGATGIPGVPSLFQILVRRSTLARRALPSLRYAMLSGSKATDRLVADLRGALPNATIYLRYGITEATAAVSCLPPELLDDKLGSIGRGVRDAPLAVEHEDGAPVVPGSEETGEVIVRGPHVTLGYFRDDAETARWFRGGAFHTGDRARVDADGFVFLVGRDKDLVKIGGHRVSTLEIEDVIARLAEVIEVAVVGVPDPLRGEALAALIVMRGTALDLAALRQHCEAHLPPWKVPTQLRAVDALPKLASGKLDRRRIRDLARLSS